MEHNPHLLIRRDRRRHSFAAWVHRFAMEHHEAIAFLGGLAAYPVLLAAASCLGIR